MGQEVCLASWQNVDECVSPQRVKGESWESTQRRSAIISRYCWPKPSKHVDLYNTSLKGMESGSELVKGKH